MDMGLLFKGLLIGLAIAAPVGPIGVLCIRRTLAEGRVAGFVSGLGAATADAAYGGVAAFGLTAIADPLIAYQSTLQACGGVFLCYLGVRTFLAPVAGEAPQAKSGGWANAYASTMILTLTNPMTILSFVAIFAGVGVVGEGASCAASALVVAGVFAGSAIWWLGLSLGVGAFRDRLGAQGMRWINRASGGVILGFGCVALLTVLRSTV
jgi:threonine/homoserine/homoserine lactone efflux protein